MTFTEFAHHMVTLGMLYGGSCISWGRTAARNEAVKGDENSLHMCWLACDMVFDTRAGAESAANLASRLDISWKWNGDTTLHFQALPPRKV